MRLIVWILNEDRKQLLFSGTFVRGTPCETGDISIKLDLLKETRAASYILLLCLFGSVQDPPRKLPLVCFAQFFFFFLFFCCYECGRGMRVGWGNGGFPLTWLILHLARFSHSDTNHSVCFWRSTPQRPSSTFIHQKSDALTGFVERSVHLSACCVLFFLIICSEKQGNLSNGRSAGVCGVTAVWG